MEDAHTTKDDIKVGDQSFAFFGVYDGHGGSYAAKYAGIHLCENITSQPDFGKDIKKALRAGFLKTDAELKDGIIYLEILVTPRNHLVVPLS